MENKSDNNKKQDWDPDKYFQILKKALDGYENEHPHWKIEVFVSILQWSLRNLKHFIEDCEDSEVSWESPFVEIHYPVDWNWDAPSFAKNADVKYSGLHLGDISKENTADKQKAKKALSEIMVRRLNTLTLDILTNGAWFEIKDNFSTPVLPIELSEQLNSIKGKRAKRAFFDKVVRPFSIGAATIDFSGMDFEDGASVPKPILKQLANIDSLIDIKRIGFSGDINGRKVETSLVFQVEPLIADYDKKKAYYPITIGLAFSPRIIGDDVIVDTPEGWPLADRNTFWKEIIQEIEKISADLIPKTERQTSQIFVVNAQLEIFSNASNSEENSATIKKILENLSQVGEVTQINVQRADANEIQTTSEKSKCASSSVEQTPKTPTEGLVRLIWNSKFRTPLIIILVVLSATALVFGILPDKAKLRILELLGFHS